MPVGNVLVRDARSDVKHDDAALAVDVVSIAETAKLLLACGIPDIKLNLAQVLGVLFSMCCCGHLQRSGCAYCCETKRVDLNTKSSDVLLLELSSQVALDEGRLLRYLC